MNPPKMPIHIGDYMRNTGHLRAAGHGAYLMLLFHYWSTGALPDDDDQLSMIARMTPTEWRKIRPMIEAFFAPGWKHGRVEKDLESARESYEKRAKAGEKGGKAKAESKQSSSNATAGPEQPLTYNHLPDTKKEKKDPPLRSDDWPTDFGDQFWEAYPRKTEKLAAMKKLAVVRKSGIVTFADLMAGVRRYAATKPDPQFTKHPTTWLNAGCWTDETQPGASHGQRNLNETRRSASDNLLAGFARVAANIAGNDQPSWDASEEIPPGRVNIDG